MTMICLPKKIIMRGVLILLLVFVLIALSHLINKTTITLINKAAPSSIIGGNKVAEGKYPQVTLLDNGCTGILIFPRIVATAAHCLSNVSLVTLDVVDRNDINSKKIEVSTSLYSPDGSDLGIIILKESVFDVSLPNIITHDLAKIYKLKKDTYVNVVGWGCIGFTITPTPSYSIDTHKKVCATFTPDFSVSTENTCITLGSSFGCKLSNCKICVPSSYADSNDLSCDELKSQTESIKKNPSIPSNMPTITRPQPIYGSNLMEIDLPLVKDVDLIHDKTFNYGYERSKSIKKGTCFGDSGGPVFVLIDNQEYLIGLNTSGLLDNTSEAVSIYPHLNWLFNQNRIFSNSKRKMN